jgi:hypothetical protein
MSRSFQVCTRVHIAEVKGQSLHRWFVVSGAERQRGLACRPSEAIHEEKPCEELAFWLSVCPLNLLRFKSEMTTEELGVISGASAIGTVGCEGPSDGISLLHDQL